MIKCQFKLDNLNHLWGNFRILSENYIFHLSQTELTLYWRMFLRVQNWYHDQLKLLTSSYGPVFETTTKPMLLNLIGHGCGGLATPADYISAIKHPDTWIKPDSVREEEWADGKKKREHCVSDNRDGGGEHAFDWLNLGSSVESSSASRPAEDDICFGDEEIWSRGPVFAGNSRWSITDNDRPQIRGQSKEISWSGSDFDENPCDGFFSAQAWGIKGMMTFLKSTSWTIMDQDFRVNSLLIILTHSFYNVYWLSIEGRVHAVGGYKLYKGCFEIRFDESIS